MYQHSCWQHSLCWYVREFQFSHMASRCLFVVVVNRDACVFLCEESVLWLCSEVSVHLTLQKSYGFTHALRIGFLITTPISLSHTYRAGHCVLHVTSWHWILAWLWDWLNLWDFIYSKLNLDEPTRKSWMNEWMNNLVLVHQTTDFIYFFFNSQYWFVRIRTIRFF